jgi:ribosome-associated heat shock protein Hsp15
LAGDGERLDKWLWHARFFRTRAAAQRACAEGRIRLNRERIVKAHREIRAGDVLTFVAGNAVRVVRVRGFAARRGSAGSARELYEDVAGPEVLPPASHLARVTALD